jgi:hypothetical protein
MKSSEPQVQNHLMMQYHGDAEPHINRCHSTWSLKNR